MNAFFGDEAFERQIDPVISIHVIDVLDAHYPAALFFRSLVPGHALILDRMRT